jgi:uncharacterized protein YigA (DUF484 family)
MNQLVQQNQPSFVKLVAPITEEQRLEELRSQIKQELRQKIQTALQTARLLSPSDRLQAIRERLLAIQTYCKPLKKTFIVVEEKITCDQYELGGYQQDAAILFRGPNEDASVAICVTSKGSLLHRNSSPWKIYKNAGDVNPPTF